MKNKLYIAIAFLTISVMLAGCSGVTNARTDKKLKSLQQQAADKGTEESHPRSYVISTASMTNDSVALLEEMLEGFLKDGKEQQQYVVTYNNDSERKQLQQKISDYQAAVIEKAEKNGYSISLDSTGLTIFVQDENTDVSEAVNDICVAKGLAQQIQAGYAEWSLIVNVMKQEDGSRIAYETVTNQQPFTGTQAQ